MTTTFDRAAAFATCRLLESAGASLIGAGVWTIAGGGAGLVPLTLGSLSFLAAGFACNPTPVGPGEEEGGVDGCQSMGETGRAELWVNEPGKDWREYFPVTIPWSSVISIDETPVEYDFQAGQYVARAICTVEVNGNLSTSTATVFAADEASARKVQWRLEPVIGECENYEKPTSPLPPNATDPIDFVDPQTGCTLRVTLQGFAQAAGSTTQAPVFRIESSPSAGLLNTSGTVGGCNIAPVIYWNGGGGNGGGGPTIIPFPDDGPPPPGPGGQPWWVESLLDLLAGVVTNIITTELYRLFEQPLPAFSRTIYAPCQYKQDGSKESFSVNFPEQFYTTRMLYWQDVLVAYMQKFADWKTPTCSGGGQPVTGGAVSINWVSDEYTAAGGNRLRKLFTYFDQVGSTLEQTVAHWKDFSWEAGPVIVSCVGTALGKPQVWAASEAEAKRVINHAASIAGVDLTNAEWLTGSPKSSRYGETGLMRVHRSGNGTLGITKRDGPSGPPMGLI